MLVHRDSTGDGPSIHCIIFNLKFILIWVGHWGEGGPRTSGRDKQLKKKGTKTMTVSMLQATADLACEGYQRIDLPQSCLLLKDRIHVSSTAFPFPERSMLIAKPLETIIAAQDQHNAHNEKFVLPVEANSTYNVPQLELNFKSQNVSKQILQARMISSHNRPGSARTLHRTDFPDIH